MSKKTEHIIAVLDKTLADEAFLSGRDKDALLRAFKTVAIEFGVSESTIRDKCTRRLGYSTDAFFSAVLGFADGSDDDLFSKFSFDEATELRNLRSKAVPAVCDSPTPKPQAEKDMRETPPQNELVMPDPSQDEPAAPISVSWNPISRDTTNRDMANHDTMNQGKFNNAYSDAFIKWLNGDDDVYREEAGSTPRHQGEPDAGMISFERFAQMPSDGRRQSAQPMQTAEGTTYLNENLFQYLYKSFIGDMDKRTKILTFSILALMFIAYIALTVLTRWVWWVKILISVLVAGTLANIISRIAF